MPATTRAIKMTAMLTLTGKDAILSAVDHEHVCAWEPLRTETPNTP